MVRVAVVLPRLVVVVALRARVVGGEPLQPLLVVLVQPSFVVVDEDRSRDVHRVDQAEALLHAAFAHQPLNAVGDVEVITAIRRLEPEMFS